MKKAKYVLIAMLMLVFALSLTACDNKTQNNPTQLVMSEVSYNDTTNIATWNKVNNATEYKIFLDGEGTDNDMTITVPQVSSGAVSKELAGAAPGEYTLNVTARGNGTTYTDSAVKSVSITVQEQSQQNQKTEVKLEVEGLAYDDTTKVVSWDKVENASGYSLRVGSKTVSADEITEVGNKMQYVMNETHPGNYNVFVRALGSETETHIYKPSDETKVVANYTIAIQKEERQLVAPVMGFDEANGVIYFNTIANANGYDLQVKEGNGAYVNKTATFNSETNRMEYSLGTAYGNYTAKVKALGGKETDSLIYTTSPYSNEIQANHQEPQQQVAYSEVEALVKEKAEAAWKEKNTLIADSFAGIEVIGINLNDGTAYLNVSRTNGNVYAVTFALGNLGNSLTNICEYINNATYTKVDISSNTQIQSQENTTLLVNALKERGVINNEVLWATATTFTGTTSKGADVTIALNNGTLVTLTLAVATSSSGQAVVNEFVGGAGSVNQKSQESYTDLRRTLETPAVTQTSTPLWYQEQDQGM